ncbi:3',5'-cyclic adenosine monophosphate phosphodiesterase CpdA [Abditibacteriota bacterium]|nr:3',5'-cyclic adenosine monophosphate phosphodiesterase CpdA [Abditibacteriota bacterium]
MSASATVASVLWPGVLAAQDDGKGDGSWRFISVNDLHYSEAACRPWFDKVVAAMKASAPDAEFCLLGGDLTDAGQPEQMANIRESFQGLGIPLYATPGNHDHLTDTDRSAYEKCFPGHTNQFFKHRGWQIIGLDTSDGTRYQNTKIHPETFAWMDEYLPKLDRTKPTIVWTHFPLGSGVNYRPLNADDLLNRLLDFNVQAAFSGHWHGFTEKSWRNGLFTTDKCCSRVRDNHDGTKEKGWFVCTVRDGRVSREFVEIPKTLEAVQTL